MDFIELIVIGDTLAFSLMCMAITGALLIVDKWGGNDE